MKNPIQPTCNKEAAARQGAEAREGGGGGQQTGVFPVFVHGLSLAASL